jgi:hypothetical protein
VTSDERLRLLAWRPCGAVLRNAHATAVLSGLALSCTCGAGRRPPHRGPSYNVQPRTWDLLGVPPNRCRRGVPRQKHHAATANLTGGSSVSASHDQVATTAAVRRCVCLQLPRTGLAISALIWRQIRSHLIAAWSRSAVTAALVFGRATLQARVSLRLEWPRPYAASRPRHD